MTTTANTLSFPDATIDRTLGEEFKLAGDSILVSGVVPVGLEVSFDGQGGARIPLAEYRSWGNATPFTRVWVFHPSNILNAQPWKLTGFVRSSDVPLEYTPFAFATSFPLTIDAAVAFGALASTPASASGNMLYNSATWDRQRGNWSATMFGTAARTAGTQIAGTNYNSRGLHLMSEFTVASGTGGVTVIIEAQNFSGGSGWYTILQSPLITSVQTLIMRVYPGLAPVANLSANDILPRSWRCRTTHGDGSSYTYSISAAYVL